MSTATLQTVSDDRELLLRWRAGDRNAGGELCARHFDELYGFFRRRVGEASIAEDLVQETLLACVRNVEGLRGDASFRTYLFRAAHSRLVDHYRRASRRGEPPTGISRLLADEPSPSTQLRHEEEHRLLRAAVETLTTEQQVVLDLYYLQGFRGPELAEVLGIPEPTVRSRLRRAKAALASRMGGAAGA